MSRKPAPSAGARRVPQRPPVQAQQQSQQQQQAQPQPQPTSALSVDWAFVLQLREGTSFRAEALCGRVEHVSSGRAALFDSLESARAFMEDVMRGGPETQA